MGKVFPRIAALLLMTVGLIITTPRDADAQSQSCYDLRSPDSKLTLSGQLSRRVFPGPPNYESIAAGDAAEVAYILDLPQPICANDGEFIDDAATFDRVHVKALTPATRAAVKAAVGRVVTVTGSANGAQIAHDHAPLVLYADEVTVR